MEVASLDYTNQEQDVNFTVDIATLDISKLFIFPIPVVQ